MQLPVFTDLRELAEDMARRGSAPSVRAAIATAWRAQSCLGDLRQSADCAIALRDLTGRPREMDTAALMTTERALLTTAVLLYARATSTSGQKDERGSIQLERTKLTPEEWEAHCNIIDVRNQALAHVYSLRETGGHVWHRDKFFAVQNPDGVWAPVLASNQTSFREDALKQLELMLPVALREVRAKLMKRMGAVARLLNGQITTAQLLKHAFDPVETFGSLAAVQAVLDGREDGETSFWVKEGQSK